MTLPSVAMIIPTRNRIEVLKRCLSRLAPYVGDHPECSITVSDDGDAAVTREALGEEMGFVQVVQGPRKGPAANRNCGAAHSTGDLLVFLDDDCIPDPNLVATYREAARNNPEIGVFEGRISAEGRALGFADRAPGNETGGYLWSCNFAIRRELFAQIGGFDERFPFPAVEDCDFHLRVKKRSAVLFLADARVWHRYERRVGWRVVQHEALSDLLFLHIRGRNASNLSPVYFLRKAVKSVLFKATHHLRAKTTKDPLQLVLQVWSDLQMALILCFWNHHAFLARRFYPPCCSGCDSIHALLAGPGHSAMPRRGAENAG